MITGKRSIDPDNFQILLQDMDNPENAFIVIQEAVAALKYLNYRGTPNINHPLGTIVGNSLLRREFAETSWNKKNPKNKIHIADFWKAWAEDYYDHLLKRVEKELVELIEAMREPWEKFLLAAGRRC